MAGIVFAIGRVERKTVVPTEMLILIHDLGGSDSRLNDGVGSAAVFGSVRRPLGRGVTNIFSHTPLMGLRIVTIVDVGMI